MFLEYWMNVIIKSVGAHSQLFLLADINHVIPMLQLYIGDLDKTWLQQSFACPHTKLLFFRSYRLKRVSGMMQLFMLETIYVVKCVNYLCSCLWRNCCKSQLNWIQQKVLKGIGPIIVALLHPPSSTFNRAQQGSARPSK